MSIDGHKIVALLERYPDVSAEEERVIEQFCRKGRFLEIGHLKASPIHGPKLRQFFDDHPRIGRPDLVGVLLLIAITIVPILLLAWVAMARN